VSFDFKRQLGLDLLEGREGLRELAIITINAESY
jgi:hypothetical protein